MRARKLAAVVPYDTPPPEEGIDAWLSGDDDGGPPLPSPDRDRSHEEGAIPRLCLACAGDDCHEHREIVRLEAPSRAVHDAVARLRAAAAEQRAAARALRALVLTEVARGRGDLEASPVPVATPCPRCLIRDAEAAAAASGVTRPARKSKGENGQQPLPFKQA
jgi:hypothetical protein